MAKAPSFQWYPKDCDSDEHVRGMDDREFGFYMRCLNHSWLNLGLPGDIEELARVLGRTKNYVEKNWIRVGKCFELRAGRFVNPKQELQRTSVREFLESRRSAANSRWEKKRERCKDDARASVMQCSPLKESAEGDVVMEKGAGKNQVPLAPPLIAFSPALVSRPEWRSDPVFEKFAADYTGMGAAVIDEDFQEAYTFLWKRFDWEQKAERVKSLEAHRVEYSSNPRFIPKPKNFLEREYKRAVRPLAISPASQDRPSLRDRTLARIAENIANGEPPI